MDAALTLLSRSKINKNWRMFIDDKVAGKQINRFFRSEQEARNKSHHHGLVSDFPTAGSARL